MTLPAGALTATLTVGAPIDISGVAGTLVSLHVRPDLPGDTPLVWAADGTPIQPWSASPAAGEAPVTSASLEVLADQPGVLTSITEAGAPAMGEIRSWPLVATWWTRQSPTGAPTRHVRRFAAPAPGTTVDLDLLPQGGVTVPATVTSAQTADLADHTEATQDVVGAMVVGAGGTYDDVAGTITLPSVVTPMIANQAHRITSRVGGTMPPSANLYPIAIRYTVRYWRIGFEITAAAAGCTALLVFYRPVSGTSNVSLVASVSINLSQVSEGYFVTLPSDLLLTQGIWLVGLVPTSAIVGGTVRTGATDTLGLPQRDINNIGLYYDAFLGVGSGWVPPATVSNLNSERMLSGSPPFIMGVPR